ncbi:hypothetical protein [Nostoc sp.]|uniref:hypothetical protein n=1 Tax=Nostoc sp. TaxID=1180 RepID=UPI002FF5AD5B
MIAQRYRVRRSYVANASLSSVTSVTARTSTLLYLGLRLKRSYAAGFTAGSGHRKLSDSRSHCSVLGNHLIPSYGSIGSLK